MKTGISLGPWLVNADADTTRIAYRRIEQSSAEKCVCGYCKNFVATRHGAYPGELLHFFEMVGIDWQKELEVTHHGELAPGIQVYWGWFQFAGQVESGPSGPDAWAVLGPGSERIYFHRLAPTCEIGVTQLDQPSRLFPDLLVVQVEFSVELRWSSDIPEPVDG